jgi:hypothetical protein
MRTVIGRLRPRRRPRSPWEAVLGQATPQRLPDASGTRVLCATGVGGHPVAPLLDSLVGTALWLRGSEVTFLLCDGALPACEQCSYVAFATPREFVDHGPQGHLCGPCFGAGAEMFRPLPLPLRRYKEFVADADVKAALGNVASFDFGQCVSFERDGLRLGEQTRASLLRFFGKADLETEPPETLVGLGLPVLGYYSHVNAEVKREADAAGVDLAVPRSRMAREMPALVERALSEAPG